MLISSAKETDLILNILVLNGSETRVIAVVVNEDKPRAPSVEQLAACFEEVAKVPEPEYEDQACSTAGGFIGAGEPASRTASGPLERPVQLASTYG